MALPILSLLLGSGCAGDRSTPGLHVRPMAVGGDQEGLLNSVLGPCQGYQMLYNGPCKWFVANVEVWRNGERLHRGGFGAGGFLAGEDVELVLLAVEKRVKENVSMLSFSQSAGGTRLTGRASLAEWDALDPSSKARTWVSYREPTRLDVTPGQPIVLWRWLSGDSIAFQKLSDELPKDCDVLQVTLTLDHPE